MRSLADAIAAMPVPKTLPGSPGPRHNGPRVVDDPEND
jgi:hypothetical protein